MILQLILLIVFLAWTLKRNLGDLISEIYCITTKNKSAFPIFSWKPRKNDKKEFIFSEMKKWKNFLHSWEQQFAEYKKFRTWDIMFFYLFLEP